MRNLYPKKEEQAESEVCNEDAIQILTEMEATSVDLIVTDPPYLVRYQDRNGRRGVSDDKAEAVLPAFAEMFRLLMAILIRLVHFSVGA